MIKEVRTRFAPSPTGGLHLGGIRTALFNYLFAKKHAGTFIVRTEDTDQTRFVTGAEDYIFNCLQWCGIIPDESTKHGGKYGPYRQSERKQIYLKYALQLIEKGFAYYAFDTAADLDLLRKENPNFQYNATNRNNLKNSLNLSATEVQDLLNNKTPFVVRIKVPDNEEIILSDLIRGDIHFNTSNIDDKVLLKADGMPTYHLAVVVDDFEMKITHAFRGEEWLSSSPIHYILWEYLFGIENMPLWAHLPLILKPTGKGKLSKRDGVQFGFPIYGIAWQEASNPAPTPGFKEMGFVPEAFVNFLALLGWNDGTNQEIFTMDELIQKFNISHIHKAGAKFDYEKAKWFNQQWIKKMDDEVIFKEIKKNLKNIINKSVLILLTVSPAGNRNNKNCRYRFQINESENKRLDLKKVFENSQNSEIYIENVKTKFICTNKHLYELGYELDNWIKERNFHEYTQGNPTKLIFEFKKNNNTIELKYLNELIISLIQIVKERCVLLTDFMPQLHYFFNAPTDYNTKNIKNWDEGKSQCLQQFTEDIKKISSWNQENIHSQFIQTTGSLNIMSKELLLPLRIALVGSQFGPDVFKIAEIIGEEETSKRIHTFILNYK